MANNFAYQSGHGNSSDQVMYTTSNRSRSESGSSDSSRGSGNSGKPRRRSHRPRGCRGGSNRRKQKMAEAGNKPFFKKTYNSDFKSRVHGKFSNSSTNQDFVINNNKKNHSRGSFHRESYNNDYGKDYNVTYPQTGPFLSAGSDLHTGANSYGHNLLPSYGSKFMSEPENDYPVIHSSYSDSSSDSFMEQRDDYSQHNHDSGILPPLPSEELFNRSAHVPTGPNPYALKSSSSDYTNARKQVHVDNHYSIQTSGPSMVLPVSRQQPILVETNHQNMAPCLPGLQQVSNDMDFNYRAHRLEKQRQNVVGGSLFITSPRSFLMNGKRPAFE